jgi:hypothetical protein
MNPRRKTAVAKTAKILTEASVQKLRPHPTKRRIIRDGGTARALFLYVQPKTGFNSWVMRFRLGRETVKMVLGPVALPGYAAAEPAVGRPLSLVQARHLAARINYDRACGADVFATYRSEKHKLRVAATDSFAAAARDFIAHARATTRCWQQTASVIGLDDNLDVKPDSLADRWGDRSVRAISVDDLHAVIAEAKLAIPGRPGTRGRARLDSRSSTPDARRALLVATAWSKPPAGRARWTLELLAGELVKLTTHDSLTDTLGRGGRLKLT